MIDPNNPDYANTPASARRPVYAYAPAEPHAVSLAPAATIVTPFYNTGPIFHETACSIMRQSFQEWEWLIVNDASTRPEALAVLDAYRHTDARIRVIDLPTNQGPSAARNLAFREARAPYVVQLDSDNLLEPTAIEKWLWFLESYPEYAFVKGYSVGFDAHEYLWQQGFHNGPVFLEENPVDATSAQRTAVHRAVGGYDETIRGGLEDWDFWLRCANHGQWGATLPEYLDWYRRRDSHADRWANWDGGERQRVFRDGLRRKYPALWNGGFPKIAPGSPQAYDTVPDQLPWHNTLSKSPGIQRLVMIVPWLAMGGADKFNLDLLEQLSRRGWQVSIATTLSGHSPWLAEFAQSTPDVFVLPNFLRRVDYPRFLRGLIRSRQADVLMLASSELGYQLLPYLRAHCPDTAFVDYCHMEEENWKNGGYPRLGVDYQELLDLNTVSSVHLKDWMRQRGADPSRIRVCHTNIDPEAWRPDAGLRQTVRDELALDEQAPVLLYAGRMCAQKQPQVFARTLHQLVTHTPQVVALVAGDGPDLAWLQTFVRRQRLASQVRLLGAVSRQRMQQLMAAADIFFLPSEWEGIALSVYEAMACGLPVVGADVGGQRELVTAACGTLITRGEEAHEVERYVAELSRLVQDPAARQAMGKAGRQRIADGFQLRHMVERMEGVLAEASQLHAAAPRPQPGPGLGLACASQAVEYGRLSQFADSLWQEREAERSVPGSPFGNTPRRVSVYFTLRRFLLPYYRAAGGQNRIWLQAVKNRLKRVLLGEGRA